MNGLNVDDSDWHTMLHFIVMYRIMLHFIVEYQSGAVELPQ